MTYAEILDQQGKSEEAIAEFEEVIKLSPDNTSAIVKIAQFFMEKQKYAEAIPYWEKFVELQPEIMGAWHNLGICYGQSGQSEKALEAVKKAESLK